MEKEDARKLLPLVNDYTTMELLKYYSDIRIRWHKKELESCALAEVQEHQGSIKELRKICDLREWVTSKAT